MTKAYCLPCKEFFEVAPGFINAASINCPQCGTERKDYPYWKDEFQELFKEYSIIYNEGKKPSLKYSDEADSYRVFMIYCNNNYDKSRMECLEDMKKWTFENPWSLEGEWFWCEKVD